MIFEDILEKIGVFGRYQQRLYLALCLRTFCSAMITLMHVFLAGEMDHWCQTPELDIVNCTKWSLDKDQCIEAKRSVAIPPAGSDSSYEYENCKRYNLTGIEPSDWFPGWVTSDVTNDTLQCDAGWVYDTSQFKTSIVTDFDLVCNKKSLPDLAQSMYFVGVLFSSTFVGAFSDNLLSESPRWLLSKGRITEAQRVIRRIAKVNKKDLPDEFFNNLELHEQEKPQEKSDKQPNVFYLFRYPYLRLKTITLMFIWFITTLVYYGLSLSSGDLGVDFYVSFFVSGAVEIPAYLYVMFALDWFGRKPNLCGSLVLGGIACLLTLLIKSGVWKTVVAMIGKFAITITFAIVFIFTTEQFPTVVRNVGLGMCSAFGRVGSVSAPLIFIISEFWEPLPFVVFGVLSIAGGLASLILPETKGKNLPETIEEGEQFGKKPDMLSDDQADDKNTSINIPEPANGSHHKVQAPESINEAYIPE
ncbi:organic cation transporter protein-like [Amphiura filiformis]|uniref:organic cation transporter protein-like n=1 Tax=Amphiura filiformis TaxID=82378 RepID=UPI003B20E544